LDSNIILAILTVCGTLAGTVIGALATYLVQSKVADRNRKWSIEDESKRIKRELLSNRLDIIEEVVNLMMFFAGLSLRSELQIPIYSDRVTIENKRKRFDEIGSQSWNAVAALSSKELSTLYSAIAAAYNEDEETGSISSETWKKANESFPKIIKLIDDMKVNI
jgi:gas vesicle protein